MPGRPPCEKRRIGPYSNPSHACRNSRSANPPPDSSVSCDTEVDDEEDASGGDEAAASFSLDDEEDTGGGDEAASSEEEGRSSEGASS